MTWTDEDDKLVTLAKGARLRVSAKSGAALRDTTGRTYASSEVDLEFLKLTAVELALGQAIAAGATGLEAVVVCAESELSASDQHLVHEFSGLNTPIYLVNALGERINK